MADPVEVARGDQRAMSVAPSTVGFVDTAATSVPRRSARRRRGSTKRWLSRPAGPSWASVRSGVAVVGVVATAAVVLRGELTPAQNLNDGAMHWSMVRWAEGILRRGRLPLDGWYPRLGLGFPQFHHYQSLPHIVTAIVAVIAGSDGTYPVMQWLLLATLPLSVWFGARLFGLDRATSLWCAALVLLPVSASGYGHELGSYVWRGYGMFPQLWGMWLTPIALGLTWRAVDEGRRPVAAGAVLGVTVLAHAIVGYLAALTVVLWVVLGGSIVGRAKRAVVIALAALCTTAWFLVPLAVDSTGATYGGYQRGTFWYDSYGARKVLGWLVTGRIYDQGRAPVLTCLVGIGLFVTLSRCRRDRLARALVASWVASVVLFCGTPTFGWLLRWLPGSRNLFFPRFLVGVHLSGVLIAGVGGAWLVRSIHVQLQRRVPSRAGFVAVVIPAVVAGAFLLPPWHEREHYAAEEASWMRDQRVADRGDGADLAQLADYARELGGGRVYGGTTFNSGPWPRVGFVPVHAALLNHDVDTVGNLLRVSSLSTSFEAQFDETAAWQYELFDVRYVVLPVGRQPMVPATFLMRRGPYALWQVSTGGYVGVVDAIDPIASNLEGLGNAVGPLLRSDLFGRGRYPLLRLPRTPTGRPTTTSYAALDGPAGTVTWQVGDTVAGRFRAQVDARRASYVVLRQSWHPRWRATVDGRAVTAVPIAPSFVAVPVRPGRHVVGFDYHPWRTEWLVLEGLLGLVALHLAVTSLESRTAAPRRAQRARLGA